MTPCPRHSQFLQDQIASLGEAAFQSLLFYIIRNVEYVRAEYPELLTPDGDVTDCPLCIHRNDRQNAKFLRGIAADEALK